MGDAVNKGNWLANPGRYSRGWAVACTDERADDDELVYVRSRQDCDDLIELLRVVRERLP
jgi:hypothetical protein